MPPFLWFLLKALLALSAPAAPPKLTPGGYCERLLVQVALRVPEPFRLEAPDTHQAVRYELWSLRALGEPARAVRYGRIAERLRASFSRSADHYRWFNLKELIVAAHELGLVMEARRHAAYFAAQAREYPLPDFGIWSLQQLLAYFNVHPDPFVSSTLAEALIGRLREQRMEYALLSLFRLRGEIPSAWQHAEVIRWFQDRGPTWAATDELQPLFTKLSADDGFAEGVKAGDWLNEFQELSAVETAFRRPAEVRDVLAALRELPAEYAHAAEEHISYLSTAAYRANQLEQRRLGQRVNARRGEGETLLSFAGRVSDEQRFPPVEQAAVIQARLTELIVALLPKFPEHALRLLPLLEPSPSTSAIYAQVASTQRLPGSVLGPLADVWEGSALLSARYLFEQFQNVEPDWEDQGRFFSLTEPANRRPPSAAPPAFSTSHYLMSHQLKLISALLRGASPPLWGRAFTLLERLPADTQRIPNVYLSSRQEEPYRSAGFASSGLATYERSFQPLTFKINALLTVGEILPDQRASFVRQAWELSRRRPRADLAGIRGRLGQLDQIATNLRLATALLEIGAIDDSLRLQNRLNLLFRTEPSSAGGEDLARLDDFLTLRRYGRWILPVKTIVALSEQPTSIFQAELLVEQLKRQLESLPAESAGKFGELAHSLLDAGILLAASPAWRGTVDRLWEAALKELDRAPGWVKAQGAARLLASGLPAATVEPGILALLSFWEADSRRRTNSRDFNAWRGVLFRAAEDPHESRLRRLARNILRAQYGPGPHWRDDWQRSVAVKDIMELLLGARDP